MKKIVKILFSYFFYFSLSLSCKGCACLDIYGDLAAGGSTGGTSNKMKGRTGDCP